MVHRCPSMPQWSSLHRSLTRSYRYSIDQLSYSNRWKLKSRSRPSLYEWIGRGINQFRLGSTRSSSADRQRQRLLLLERHNQSYSFSIWINPSVIRNLTIVHVSSPAAAAGWSLPLIRLTNTNQLLALSWNGSKVEVTGPVVPANSWTQVAVTCHLDRGLRLYANGSLYNASDPFSFAASNRSNYLFVGSSLSVTHIPSQPYTVDQHCGAVDDLRVYSRELTGHEMNALANA